MNLLAERMESGDRNSGQLVELLRATVSVQQQQLTELKTMAQADREAHAVSVSAVRVDLDRQLGIAERRIAVALKGLEEHSEGVDTKVDALRLNWSKMTGFGAALVTLSTALNVLLAYVLHVKL